MRSSKQRSRSKQNRNRSVGNIVNRVFDSSGPEGKVRGTPQQIIDKYNQLARDAQLSGDRVATENFQQHAEHYTRMLAEAMKEQEQRREQQEQQQRDRQQQRQNDRNQNNNQQNGQQNGQGVQTPADPAEVPQPGPEQPAPSSAPATVTEASVDPADAPQPDIAPDVIDTNEGDSGLVETPESKPAPKRRGRPRKKPAEPKADAPDAPAPEGGPAEAAE